ncbi:MAG: hypothetical protein PUG22_04495 [Peptoniphilaceae bacterium]|nr:hypothetical protein [Peptoniphilaceae bacterium]
MKGKVYYAKKGENGVRDLHKEFIKSKIRDYYFFKDSVVNIKNRIDELKNLKESVSHSWGADPVKGGGSKNEEKILNINAEIELYSQRYRDALDTIKRVECAKEKLSDMEFDFLIEFYAKNSKNAAEKLSRKYHYSRSGVYFILNSAFDKFEKSFLLV